MYAHILHTRLTLTVQSWISSPGHLDSCLCRISCKHNPTFLNQQSWFFSDVEQSQQLYITLFPDNRAVEPSHHWLLRHIVPCNHFVPVDKHTHTPYFIYSHYNHNKNHDKNAYRLWKDTQSHTYSVYWPAGKNRAEWFCHLWTSQWSLMGCIGSSDRTWTNITVSFLTFSWREATWLTFCTQQELYHCSTLNTGLIPFECNAVCLFSIQYKIWKLCEWEFIPKSNLDTFPCAAIAAYPSRIFWAWVAKFCKYWP